MRDPVNRALIVAGFLVFAGCDVPPARVPESLPAHFRFEDSAAQLGVQFQPEPRGVRTWFFPAIMAGGAALADFDNDNDLDIFLLNTRGPQHASASDSAADRSETAGPSRLYLQSAEGKFDDATSDSGLTDAEGNGCAVGDVNNDGRTDLYVTAWGAGRLFLNRGEGRFEQAIDAVPENNRWATSAAFLDYDRDGWLDLFVTNYVEYDPGHACLDAAGRQDFCNPAVFRRTSDRLFRNITGKDDQPVRFQDVTAESGIASAQGAGLGVLAADLTGDGYVDVYVANDGHGNFLWENQKDGTFQEKALLLGAAYDSAGLGQGSMGLGIGDLNSDQRPDLLVTNLDGESNAVYESGALGFADVSVSSGMSRASFRLTGFGTAFSDGDNDGDLDVFVLNGRVRRSSRKSETRSPADSKPATGETDTTEESVTQSGPFPAGYAETPLVMVRDGSAFTVDGTLNELRGVGRSLCRGDINQDGKLDFLATFLDRPAAVLLNRTETSGHWLQVRLIEPRLGDRDAIGASVTLHTTSRKMTEWLAGGGSYQCASDLRLHFGLGSIPSVDSIEVVWPSGDRERFPGVSANQTLVLRHGEGVQLQENSAR